jgi:hypothetical protein
MVDQPTRLLMLILIPFCAILVLGNFRKTQQEVLENGLAAYSQEQETVLNSLRPGDHFTAADRVGETRACYIFQGMVRESNTVLSVSIKYLSGEPSEFKLNGNPRIMLFNGCPS